MKKKLAEIRKKSTLSFLSFFSRKRFRLIKNKKMNTHGENNRNFALDYFICYELIHNDSS